MDIIMPVLLGLERICADEVLELGYSKEEVILEDGLVRLRVSDDKDEIAKAVAKMNIHLATAERVEIELFSFKALDFDSFFDQAEALPWEKYIPDGAAFSINGYSRRSQLFSTSDLQSLLKKAIVNRLLDQRYPGKHIVPEHESIGHRQIKFAFMDDICSLRLDTSGDGLHKRAYRLEAGEAPLSETLAAALIRICRWKPYTEEALVDPFCGSGTILIEAAMMAAGMAPGLRRGFVAETWEEPFKRAFTDEKELAKAKVDLTPPEQIFIYGMDLDSSVLHVAEENARRAGVEQFIEFRRMDARDLSKERLNIITKLSRQQIITNPPYGERMSSEYEVRELYADLGDIFLDHEVLHDYLRIGLITSSDDFEYDFGRVADKRRKLYNGMIRCTFYQYFRRYPKRRR